MGALLFVVLVEELELFYVLADALVLVVFYTAVDVLELAGEELLGGFYVLVLVLGLDDCEFTFSTLGKLSLVLLGEVVVWGESGK